MKKEKLPNIITILVLTIITIILWIALNIYRSFTVKPVPSVPNEILAPLTPSLDTDTIKQIEAGIYLDSSQIPGNVAGSPSPIATSKPLVLTASPSASPSANPVATP